MGRLAGDFATTVLMGVIAALYATVGQAGGTPFVAVMALTASPADEIRPISLALNIVAASYATWRLNRGRHINWKQLRSIMSALAAGRVRGRRDRSAGARICHQGCSVAAGSRHVDDRPQGC